MKFDDEKITFPIRGDHPAAPASGKRRLYALDDGWHSIDDAGVISKHSMDFRQPFLFFRDHMISTAGNAAFTRAVVSSQAFNVLHYRNSGTLGDRYEISVPLDAGDYIFGTLGARNSTGGTETFKLGTTTIGTFNYYAATATYNVFERTLITISAPDLYTFSAEMTAGGGGSGFKALNTLHFFTPRVDRSNRSDFV